MAMSRLVWLIGLAFVLLGLLICIAGQARKFAALRLHGVTQAGQAPGAAAPGAKTGGPDGSAQPGATGSQQTPAADPGIPAAHGAPAGGGQRPPGRAAGKAPAPELTVIEIQGERLEQSGYARSPYIYAKDDYARYSGKDRRVRLHRYSLSGELLWTTELGYFIDLAELPGGKIFVGGTMMAWLLDDQGKLLHEEKCGEGADIFAQIATAPDGTILCLLNQTWLYAFTADGKFLWKHGPGDHQAYRLPDITPSGVLVLYDQHSIVGLNLKGAELWRLQVARTGNVILSGDTAIYQVDDDTIACLDANTGKQLWTADYPGLAIQFSYIGWAPARNNTVILWAFQGGLRCLGADGKVLWSFDESSQSHGIPDGICAIAVDQDGNSYLTNNNQLLSLDPAGRERWRVDGPGWMLDSVVTAGAYIFVESETRSSQQHLLCFGLDGNLVWDMDKLPSILGPSYYNNGAMVFPEPYDEKTNTQRLHVWQP
jgi:outer membrane protein assembly factor BamB